MSRWSEQDLQSILSRQPFMPKMKPGKYNNKITFLDGRRFDSKKEAKRYEDLKLMKAASLIRGFACQVCIPLASGKRRMRLDFMIVENDGRIRFEDVKGMVTKDWAVKRDELEYQLGIKIEVL